MYEAKKEGYVTMWNGNGESGGHYNPVEGTAVEGRDWFHHFRMVQMYGPFFASESYGYTKLSNEEAQAERLWDYFEVNY